MRESALEIAGLHKSYGKKPVLTGVDLCVEKGEIKGLIGINGAGKTTLIECVCGINPFAEGRIRVEGEDASSSKGRRRIRALIGYMPQSFGMFNDLTVRENLAYLVTVYDIEKARVESCLKECFLEEMKDCLASRLSGGYKQMLSLACAIIHRPTLLILDEPTVAMDPLFRERFWRIVKKLNQDGCTILFITHHLEELEKCDSFACLAEGRIVCDEKLSDLSEKDTRVRDAFLARFFGEEKV